MCKYDKDATLNSVQGGIPLPGKKPQIVCSCFFFCRATEWAGEVRDFKGKW